MPAHAIIWSAKCEGIPSLKYRQCMASRDWQFGHLETLPRRFNQRAPASDDSTPPATDFPSSSPPAQPDDVPPPVEVAPPAPDIHPFCPNTIC
jgi:hypothetical protein